MIPEEHKVRETPEQKKEREAKNAAEKAQSFSTTKKEEVSLKPDDENKTKSPEAEKAKQNGADNEVKVESYKYPVEVEWTVEGLEETLATIGIICEFDTEVSEISVSHYCHLADDT